ncbi:MAG: hypothetical protein DI539_16290 [Flavobacterium psychrophilum]|nr:MAG: hypothetical protein DI539_16290 [Flavobacterium psychrophilum]
MIRFQNITRKAVLIGCPGKRSTFLRGVKKDLQQMSRFLQSNKGGAWKRDEIILLDNPSVHETVNIIQALLADYLLIYFSGHGYTDILSNNRMISLRDGNIPDWQLLNESPRQLVLVDACRNYLAPGLSGIPAFEDSIDHFEGAPAYELFSECIAMSPHGSLIVHATQEGKYSYDSPNGGYFTQALMHVSTRMNTDTDYSPCSIKSILAHVPKVLKSMGNTQTPVISYTSGVLRVPFAFGSVSPTLCTIKNSNDELAGTLLLTFILLGVVIAATN